VTDVTDPTAVTDRAIGLPALEARGLCKRFGALKVTDNVNLRLMPGARTALIGPNGAGKTTLVHLLSGVVAADEGGIAMGGMDITKAPPQVRARHGLVRTFQITSLFARLTVLENLYLALVQRAGKGFSFWRPASRERELLARAEALIERLRLSDDRHRCVGEIAYGRQRLVEIGLALALEPKVLLLDEPAAGIPSTELDLLLDAVDSLPPEITVLMIEHDMEMVRRFAHEVIVLVNGRVLTAGSPDTVMADPEVRRVYLGDSGVRRFQGGGVHA
jgi:ABC-type branched-subunit amino acid transport system ATPase component